MAVAALTRIACTVAAWSAWAGCLLALPAAAQETPSEMSVSVSLPEKLGTLQYDGVHEYEDPLLGISVSYQGRGQILTIYFYNLGLEGIPDGVDSDVVLDHFEQTKRDVLNSGSYSQAALQREGRVRLGDGADALEALEAEFRIIRKDGPLMSSYLALTASQGLFVKLRFSVAEGAELEATANRHAVYAGLQEALPTIRRKDLP